jgi:hypothetical protein
MIKKRGEMSETMAAPFGVLFFVFMYSITSPMNYSNMGHLFFYPLYSEYNLQCLYTSGTWLWVFTIIWVMAKFCNEKFNDPIYNYVTGSSLYSYLSHYFFILIISVTLVRPYKISFIPALFLMFFGTQLCIFLTYVPLNFLYEFVFPPSETKKKNLENEETPGMEAMEKQMERAKAFAKAEAIEGKEGAVDLEAE